MHLGSSGQDAIRSKQRNTNRSRTREQGGDRDAGDIRVGARGSPGSRRPLGAIGNGGEDWNASQTSVRLANGFAARMCDGEFSVSVSPIFSSAFDAGNFGS